MGFLPLVGDAEAEIRKAFRLASQAAPCILLLDEIDALVTNRSVLCLILSSRYDLSGCQIAEPRWHERC
jgi:AAA+ superfamily predicted ATPase